MSSVMKDASDVVSDRLISSRRQGGIATILIMLLIGLSLTAVALGSMYYIRGTQSQLLSVHSQTQAQMRAWTAVEAIRQYILSLNANEKLKDLAQQVANNSTTRNGKKNASGGNATTGLTINGLTGVSAAFVAVDSATDPKQFTVEVTGLSAKNTDAAASSTLRVVYAIENATKPKQPKILPFDPGAVTFNKNLATSGGISIESDNKETLNVKGDFFNSGGVKLEGISVLNVEGSFAFSNGSTSFDEINANCDINMNGVIAKRINARRHVCSGSDSGSAATESIKANGKVSIQSTYSPTNGAIQAIGVPVDIDSCRPTGSAQDNDKGYAPTCSEPDPNYVVDLGDVGSVHATEVKAKGNVRLGYGHIGYLEAEGGLSINWNATVNSTEGLASGGRIKGSVSGNGAGSPVEDKVSKKKTINDKNIVQLTVEDSTLDLSLPLVSRVTVKTWVVDANDYKSAANYAFTIDDQQFIKVHISNVEGVSDGDYYVGNLSSNDSLDFACATLDASATPTSPVCGKDSAKTAVRICRGESYHSCFEGTDRSKHVWGLSGPTSASILAPGVAWFDGTVNLGSGGFYNTIVATENITTYGANKIFAPNFAGYSGYGSDVPMGMCVNSTYPDLRPKQFCNADKTFNAGNDIGNYAAIAGSVKGGKYTGPDSYIGGNIATGASTEWFGSVIAGNEYNSSGETIIHGYITALAAGVNVTNTLSAKTTLKLKNLPTTFSPGGIKTPPVPDPGDPAPTPGQKTVVVKWTRYL